MKQVIGFFDNKLWKVNLTSCNNSIFKMLVRSLNRINASALYVRNVLKTCVFHSFSHMFHPGTCTHNTGILHMTIIAFLLDTRQTKLGRRSWQVCVLQPEKRDCYKSKVIPRKKMKNSLQLKVIFSWVESA